MTEERDEDGQVARKYRELGAQEPPRALDDAILAASRRAAGAGPGRPAARSGFLRWQGPAAAAAVLVLAIAVTLNMQLERPGIQSIESPASRAVAPAAEPKPFPAAPAAAELKLKAEDQLSARAKDAGVAVQAMKQKTDKLAESRPMLADQAPARYAEPAAASPAAAANSASVLGGVTSRGDDSRNSASSVTGALARQTEERTARDAEAAARAPQVGPLQALTKRSEMEAKPAVAPAPARAAAAPAAAAERAMADTPERELERIAELRRQERHEEADKALAEFRKRYPEFKIPNATLERVERR